MTSTSLAPRPLVPADCRIGVCFHGIGSQRRELEDDEAGYWVGTDQFHAILDEVMVWPRVELSFDDGNVSDLEIALPALRDRGLTAAFYALAGRLDEPGSLAAADLGALVDAGMEVGTHGWRHVPWTDVHGAEMRVELTRAREVLAEAVGRPVDRSALPLGRYNRRVLGELRRAGYRSVATSDRTVARQGRWLQHRFSVHARDTPESLRAVVSEAATPWRRAAASAKGVVKRLR